MIRIVLAGPPRGKGRPRFVKATGRTYTPEDTRSYEAQLRWAAQIEMRGRAPLLGPLVMVMTSRMPIPKSFSKAARTAAIDGRLRPITKPDFDNFGKCVDAFNKIVWNDDAQVVDARILKFYSEKPEMEVVISPLTDLF